MMLFRLRNIFLWSIFFFLFGLLNLIIVILVAEVNFFQIVDFDLLGIGFFSPFKLY